MNRIKDGMKAWIRVAALLGLLTLALPTLVLAAGQEHGFTWYDASPVAGLIPIHVFHALVALLLIVLVSWRIRASLAKANDPLVPDTGFSARNVFELVVGAISNQLRAIIGPTGDKYMALIGGLFIFIFFCNIIAIVPGFLPATDTLNTNLAMSVTVFLLYNYYGFKEHGLGYLKQFAGPIVWLAPLMFVIELLSHLFRPMSLSIRLFGNMFGDHMVLSIFSQLVPLVVPVIFMILGIVVSMIQAFVFALLTAVYIGLAVSHDH
jgi:F-type H+-transporting ATPase subunit a